MSVLSDLHAFFDSVTMQLEVAMRNGLSADSHCSSRGVEEASLTFAPLSEDVSEDAVGRMTRNGLGSLEIGAGKTRVDE